MKLERLGEIVREPVEVYELAVGNQEPLIERYRAGPLRNWDIEALALFHRGELVPPKRRQGQRSLAHLDRTPAALEQSKLASAKAYYDKLMAMLREEGTGYGAAEEVAAHVSGTYAIEPERFHNFRNRSRKNEVKGLEPNPVVFHFHNWLHKTGRLPEFPPYISFGEEILCWRS